MIFRSIYPDLDIPETALTPLVLHKAAKLGDKPALIDALSGRTLTFTQLADGVQRMARGLADRGFKKGDVFATYSFNTPDYAIAVHGVNLIGGINTTINPFYTVDEVVTQLTDCRAKYLLTTPPLMDKAREATSKAGIETIFVFGEAEGATPFADLLANDGHPPDMTINAREDIAALPYSGGTTGLPKGVMLTHYNLVADIIQTEGFAGVEENDRVIAILPFFHIYGLQVLLNVNLYYGATLVILNKFDLESILKTIQDFKITRAYVAPPIMLGLSKDPAVDNYDLSSLKTVTCGAAPLSAELSDAVKARLKCNVKQGYGMTEASPGTHIIPDDPAYHRAGAAGMVLRNTECKLVDTASGEELGPNQNGEVLVRGPQVMKGYLNQPEATAQTIDREGWLHTGDIGFMDDDGYLFVVDRLKELIKYKGSQVAPAELEALLLTHPMILDSAVVPAPDEEAGEIPVAYVVTRGEVSADEVMEFVAGQVSPHKKVRRVEFIDKIPKTASGKILRRVLIDKERAAVAH